MFTYSCSSNNTAKLVSRICFFCLNQQIYFLILMLTNYFYNRLTSVAYKKIALTIFRIYYSFADHRRYSSKHCKQDYQVWNVIDALQLRFYCNNLVYCRNYVLLYNFHLSLARTNNGAPLSFPVKSEYC